MSKQKTSVNDELVNIVPDEADEMSRIAETSNPPPPVPKVPPRRMKANTKILAQIDALLDKADGERPNGAWLILQYIAGDRGLELRQIGGSCDDRR